MKKVFALLDCNNFFVSCERIFNPALNGKPVVVLSSNDGCIVARSNEAKQLGIPMGAPFFQYRSLIEQRRVHVFSSNFNLYGDISNRIMHALHLFVEDIEVYSIDEAFLRLSHTDICYELRKIILKWIGVPVSIGIGPTKTLAKLASDIAKKNGAGVFDIRTGCNDVL